MHSGITSPIFRRVVVFNIDSLSPVIITLNGKNQEWRLLEVTPRNIPEDAILHSHRRENLKSYNGKIGCAETHAKMANATTVLNYRLKLTFNT
jgi:hypothetical protein